MRKSLLHISMRRSLSLKSRPSAYRIQSSQGFQVIKPHTDGAGYTASYVPVKLMIAFMYRIPARQIVGGPHWLEEDRYDIEAKADKRYSVDDLNTMYQNLLVNRFHLKFHIETKEANAYVLTIDKNGNKMKVNEQPQSYGIPITFSGIGVMNGVRVPMPYFCWTLGRSCSKMIGRWWTLQALRLLRLHVVLSTAKPATGVISTRRRSTGHPSSMRSGTTGPQA